MDYGLYVLICMYMNFVKSYYLIHVFLALFLILTTLLKKNKHETEMISGKFENGKKDGFGSSGLT